MALCLAHATAGYLAYEFLRPPGAHRPLMLAGAVALANVPDLDFVPGLLLGDPSAFHRGVTHTLAGVLIATTIAAAIIPRLQSLRAAPLPRGGWTTFVFVALASHLLVDVVSVDTTPPCGAAILWPFSDHLFYAPFTGLGDLPLDRESRLGFVRSLVAAPALLAWARELALLVATVALVHVVRGATAVQRTASAER